MADLKNTWKKTGKDLGHAFRDLGKAIVHTAAVGAKKADAWADPDAQEADIKAHTADAVVETEKKDGQA